MDIVQRLKQYMSLTGLPTTQFADTAQIPRPTLSQILNGRNKKVSHELIEKLHVAFPSLNIMWLMFGDGNPEVDSNIETSRPQNTPNLFNTPSQDSDKQDIAEPPRQNHQVASPKQSVQKQVPQDIPGDLNITFDDVYISQTPDSSANDIPSQNSAQQITIPLQADKRVATIMPDSTKRIKTIMVCYDDNSYETFTPSPI